MINFFFTLILLSLSLNGLALTVEEAKKYDELEGMAYVKGLFRDRKFEEVLKEAMLLKYVQAEKAELVSLMAQSHAELKNWKEIKSLLKINESLQSHIKDYNLHMIRADFFLAQYHGCVERFNKIVLEGIQGPDWMIYRQCLSKDGKQAEALKTFLYLESNDDEFYLQGQELLLENSLQTFARERRTAFLKTCQSVRSYLEMNNRLKKFKIIDERVLEIAHACHPNAMEITSLLIKDLFAKGNFHSVGYLFEQLSSSNKEFYKHAAEFYKVAGRQELSRFYFQLSDEKTYILSRAAEYLNAERFVEFLSLPIGAELRSDNEEIVYAQGFSAFKSGNVVQAQKIIADSPRKSARIRDLLDLLEKCKQLDWRCRP